MFDLSGRAALITGASGGIGGAIARALQSQGATVGLSGTRLDPLEALAGELGERAHVLPCDLSDADAVAALPKQAVEAMGAVDILVNNAGVTRDGLLMSMSDEQFDEVIDTNLRGAFRLIRAVSRHMIRARSGRIINITSVTGVAGNAGQANYAAAKAGLIGLTKSVAKEFGKRGITCNAVAPGFIETDMTDVLPEKLKAQVKEFIPLQRFGKPEEIASLVAYLAGPGGAYITGQVLLVDGGLHI